MRSALGRPWSGQAAPHLLAHILRNESMTRSLHTSRTLAIPTLLVCMLATAPPTWGEGDALDPGAILARARAAADAGGSRSAEFVLEVRAPTWSAERRGRFYKDVRPDGRDSLIVLDEPGPVRGVKVLSRQSADGPSHQWLYVPSSHSARRIAGGESGRSLFGSDFSASDLEQRRAGLRAVLERREIRDGHEVYVLAITGAEDGNPVDERVWIRVGDFRVVRREFQVAGRLQRIYSADVVEAIDGVPTATTMTIVNVAAGTRSRIRLRNVHYGAMFDPMLFAVQHLDDRSQQTTVD